MTFFGVAATLLVAFAITLNLMSGGAAAGPVPGKFYVESGNIQDGQSVAQYAYKTPGPMTSINTTPVASKVFCGAGNLHAVEVVLVGTITGTNSTLDIAWQNSYDGVNWTTTGSIAQINATTTPTAGKAKQQVSDVQNATTAIAYGPCWRTLSTLVGTGTVVANYSINGIDK